MNGDFFGNWWSNGSVTNKDEYFIAITDRFRDSFQRSHYLMIREIRKQRWLTYPSHLVSFTLLDMASLKPFQDSSRQPCGSQFRLSVVQTMLHQAVSTVGPLTSSQSSSYVRVVLSKSYKRSPVTSTSSSPPDLYHFKNVKKQLLLYNLIYLSIKISYVAPLSESLHMRHYRKNGLDFFNTWFRVSLAAWVFSTTLYAYTVSCYLYIICLYITLYQYVL